MGCADCECGAAVACGLCGRVAWACAATGVRVQGSADRGCALGSLQCAVPLMGGAACSGCCADGLLGAG